MAKKFDEMKEVISSNTTPVKGAIGNATSALAIRLGDDDDGSSELNPDGKLELVLFLMLLYDIWRLGHFNIIKNKIFNDFFLQFRQSQGF